MIMIEDGDRIKHVPDGGMAFGKWLKGNNIQT